MAVVLRCSMKQRVDTFRVKGREVFILLFLLLFMPLWSCAGKGPAANAGVDQLLARQDRGNKEIRNLNDKFFASVAASPKPEDYILGQGDLLQVTVFESSDLNASVRVGARGFITLPLIGSVEVKGLSARAAEQKIENLYKQKYIQNPHVNVFVKEQQGAKVTVLGAVKKPGTYDFPARRHLMDVLAMAEGLDDKAGKMVQVKRTGEGVGQPQTFVIDMEALVKGGRSDLNLEIRKGDVVFVPEAGMVYVDGAVQKPGNYPIKGNMSVQEAVVAAGGLTSTADRGKVKLIRCGDDGKPEIVSLDENNVSSAGMRSLKLKDRDVVFVETSTLRAMVYGLNLSFMGFGVGYNPPTH